MDRPSLPAELQRAVLWHRQGSLEAADQAYRQWILGHPHDAFVLHQLGVLALQRHRPEEAEELLTRASRLDPANSSLLRHLGDALSARGQHERAEVLYRQALERAPNDSVIRLHLGNALRGQGRFLEAESVYRELVEAAPAFHPGLLQLGLVLSDQGHFEAALPFLEKAHSLGNHTLEQALALTQALLGSARTDRAEAEARKALGRLGREPRLVALHGDALRQSGRFDEAEAALREAVAAKPAPLAAWQAYAKLRLERGHAGEAVQIFRQLATQAPQQPEVLQGLVVSLLAFHRRTEAESEAWALVQRHPRHAGGWATLANLLVHRTPSEAGACAQRALEIAPDDADALAAASASLHLLGERGLALGLMRKAAGKRLEHAQYGSAFLFLAAQTGAWGPDRLLAEAKLWSGSVRRHPSAPASVSGGTRPLRIGYLSPDFRDHAVASFIEPVLAAHQRHGVEVYAYAHVALPDATTQRLQSLVDPGRWHGIVGLDDRGAASLIRSHELDVLVDLAGHTSENRLGILAQRAAPVQATYLGFFGTTGLAEMDYWIGDPVLFSGATAEGFSEKIWRLPRCWLCYQPPPDSPPVASPELDRPFTVGSFNNILKVSPETIARWASVLRGIPDARLLLKTRSLEDPGQRQRLFTALKTLGIAENRITLQPRDGTRAAHLAQYQGLDLALDTLPFNGGTTTAEALWMGVPVLTIPGATMPSRMSASMLHAAGLDEWIARDADDYVRRATAFAAVWRSLSREERQSRREEIRMRVRQSPLMDAASLARELELAYRQMAERTGRRFA